MASITGGIPLIGFVSPTDELDEYPVTNPKYGLGGLRTIGASAGLSLIPQQRREEGMIVFAEDEEKYYHLFGGTGDEHWTELKFDGEDGATGPTGPPVRFTFGQTFPEVEESRLGDYFLGASGSGDYEGGLFIFAPLDEDEGVTGTWWEISGVKGDDGDDGATGVQGFQGITGHQGFQGSTGADGFVGGTGPTGVQGFQGITGHQGFQGFSITGATGVQGFQGITGHQGFQGFSITGPTGVQGFQGHTGFQGFQGTTGPAGSGKYFYGPTAPEDTAEGLTLGSKWFNTEVGGEFTYLSDPGNNPYWVMTNVFSATGPQGPLGGGTGNQGFQGTTGPTGFQGTTGPTGFQGFQGHTGFQGFQGTTGPTGFQGFQGHTGFQGFQGTTGPTGFQGFQGHTGFQGFQGTTGPTGVQGFQGHTGFQGFQGTTGPAGSGKYFYGPTAPEDTAEGLTLGSKWFNTEVGGEFTYLSDPGNNPYWVMTNVFSATGPQGPIGGGTGNQGFQGPTGPKGDPGEAAAQGNTGPTGVQGFQGHTGFQGFQGTTGPTGVQGFQGHTGFQGFQGTTGPTGVQGFQGHTGFQGFQGTTGPTGVQGFQGHTGFQGFQGTTGAKGETGDGLFDTTYATGTEKSNSINYSTIGSVSGNARKIPVLLDDGSLTFDYMRTTDLIPNFALQTFKFDNTNTAKDYLIGVGTFDVSGDSVSFTYIPDDATISNSTITLEESLSSSGFPFSMGTTTSSTLPSGAGISYPTTSFPSNGIHGVTLRLTTTASDDSDDTRDFEIRFKQNNYYGVTSSSSINGEDLNLLASYLDNNYATSFTVDANSGEFIYFAYPIRYGDDAEFQFATTQVTFDPVHDSGGSTHTNPNDYQEKYYIFKSRNSGLGPGTTINVI